MSDLTNPLVDDEVISTLLNDGLEQGYLTYDQILEALPDIENKKVVFFVKQLLTSM